MTIKPVILREATQESSPEKDNLTDGAKLLDQCIDDASSLDDELSKIATGGGFGEGVNDAACK